MSNFSSSSNSIDATYVTPEWYTFIEYYLTEHIDKCYKRTKERYLWKLAKCTTRRDTIAVMTSIHKKYKAQIIVSFDLWLRDVLNPMYKIHREYNKVGADLKLMSIENI